MPLLRTRVETFRQLAPLVGALRNPNLKPHHLERLEAEIGISLPRGDELGLQPALFQLDRLTRDIGQQIFTFRDHSLASERHHLYNY